MKIGEALPQIFQRSYPVLEPGLQMLLALSLLRFHQIDALPIFSKSKQKKRLAVFGFSCLSKLLETDPKDYGKFLELPCDEAALELSAIGVDSSIEDLLRVFSKTKFGFSWVESDRLGGFASLRDLIELYGKGIITSSMTAGDVASPIFSLPGETTIKKVLEEMFSHRFRRVFVSGEKSLVTDRRIISYLFSTSRLGEAGKKPERLLDAKLSDLEKVEPVPVKSKVSIKTAVMSIRNANEDCLICEKGVVTPWDLIMKPMEQGKLKINE